MTTTLLIGTAKGAFFFHSDDDRQTWRMSGPYLDGWEVYSLYGCPRTGRLFAGTSHFVYGPTIRVSDDQGKTWRQIEKGPSYAADRGFKLQRIWQITPGHSSEPGTLYAGVEDAGIFVSRDNGESWTELDGLTRHPTRAHWFPGGGGLCCHTIVPDQKDPKRITVGISAAGVFSIDRWRHVVGPVQQWPARRRHRSGPGRRRRLLRSQDRSRPAGSGACSCSITAASIAATTTPTPRYRNRSARQLRFSPGGDGRWNALPRSAGGRRAPPRPRRQAAVYRSRDGGGSWAPAGEKGFPAEPQYVGVLRDAMTTDKQTPGGIYFGTSMGEVFASRDGGESWQQLPGQFPRITMVRVMEGGGSA